MANLEAKIKAMFEAKTWESLIAVIEAIMELVFGIVADDEDLEYTPVA